MAEAHARYGSLPWKDLVQPAIDLALNGFPLTQREARRLTRLQETLKKYNTILPDFLIRDEWKEGDTIYWTDLGHTLERIRDYGAAGFYEGKTADDIVADAKRMHLGHTHRADGRWRVYAFDGVEGGLVDLAAWLTDDPESPLHRFRREGDDLDAVIDVHGVLRGTHHGVDVTGFPEALIPRSGPLGLQDWEKLWAVDPRADVFADRGVAASGAIVVVRPDQYVAHVLPLSAREELTAFFGGFLLPQRSTVLQ